MDDLLEESQEREENQAKITLEEPHGQETGRVENPDRERGLAKRSKSSTPPNPRRQKPDLKSTEIGDEDAIPINEEHRYPDNPEAEKRVRRPHQREAGDKGRQEDQPRNPREGQEDPPAERASPHADRDSVLRK